MPFQSVPVTAPQLALLDRDGVINVDSPDYIKCPAEWRALPGALDAIALLNRAGIAVAVCSNQSGIGRGLFSEADLQSIHDKLANELSACNGHLDALAYCPHDPSAGCSCRKPKPGLLNTVLQKLGSPRSATVFIGDSLRDLQAAEAAEVQPVLVRTGNGMETERVLTGGLARNTLVYDDLFAAAQALTTCGQVSTQ